MKNTIKINYVIENEIYIGYVVNFPSVLAQSDSLENLEKRLLMLLKLWLKHFSDIIEDPNKIVELEKNDWL